MSSEGLICMTLNCIKMSKSMSIEEYGEKIRENAKKVLIPKTEEDHMEALNHWIRFALHAATEQYRGWAGFADLSGVSIDDITEKLTAQDLACVVHIVSSICEKFNVTHPARKRSPKGQKSFKKWYNETCKKMGLKEKYPEFIFNKIA